MRSKMSSVLLSIGAAVTVLALMADMISLALHHEVAGWLMALTTLGLGAVGAGVALIFTDDVKDAPDLQEIISRARQQTS